MDEATARRMMERTKYGDKWAVFWCDEIADLAQFWLDHHEVESGGPEVWEQHQVEKAEVSNG
jgi:hypothetical protein